MTLEYRIGDVFDRLAEIPDGSIDLIVTSPPFLALRSYLPADHPDKHREIGSEPTPAEFIDTLLALSAEWGRVLAPHGSLCVELGDTYSGGGGENHLWDNGYSGGRVGNNTKKPKGSGRTRDISQGWPLAKSMVGVPFLYELGLSYGRNLLTGEPSPAGQWRVRNRICWARPNPPVGALGDKFRPATSYITVACKGAKRYFDLDAVRTPSDTTGGSTGRRILPGDDRKFELGAMPNTGSHPAGAPPLDWHADDHPEDGDWLWKLSTQPYKGSHYATFPLTLPKRLIEAMCPLRVCTVCGKPSEREVSKEYSGLTSNGRTEKSDSPYQTMRADSMTVETLGWTDCGHGSYRCCSCHVLVPLDHAVQRPREGARSETQVSDEALLVESSEGAGGPAEHAGNVRAVRNRIHGATGGAVLHPELFTETGTRGGQSELDSATQGEPGPQGEPPGIRADVGARGHAREAEERVHDGASRGGAGTSRPAARAVGDRPPSERDQGRQPDRESGSSDEGAARGRGDVPELPAPLSGQLGGYVCPCGSHDVEYVADHWRTGIVLDPFAGSGTTLEAAQAVGRHAIGIDLDERNADLARDRVGMFMDVAS